MGKGSPIKDGKRFVNRRVAGLSTACRKVSHVPAREDAELRGGKTSHEGEVR